MRWSLWTIRAPSFIILSVVGLFSISFGQTQPKPVSPTQGPGDVVELRADLVTITATVVTPQGHLVADLKQDDFDVLEDGVAQKIISFSSQGVAPFALVMVFDASLSVRHRLQFEKDAAAKFFRSVLRPNDLASVLSVSTEVSVAQGFTSDLRLLMAAISKVQAEGTTALYDGIARSADALLPTDGRHVIVVISDGRDIISRISLLGCLRLAQEADAVIYAINTSGKPASANDRDLVGERALETLANRTGGEVFFPDRIEELDPVFQRLANQIRSQYLLGYYSSNEARDGSYRRIAVRIRRNECYARAREGYYALKK